MTQKLGDEMVHHGLHVQGAQPKTGEVMELRNTLLCSEDLRQPADLKAQLERDMGLSEDAGKSLMGLLQAGASRLQLLCGSAAQMRQSDS